MVGAINPNSSTPIERQRNLAQDSAYMLNPGEAFPAESPVASSSSSTIPIAGGANGGGAREHGLAPGAIAGIVLAAISVVVLAALLFFFWGRTKTLRDEVERKQSTVARRTSPSDSSAPMLPTADASGLGIYQHHMSPETPQQIWGSSGPSNFSPIQKSTSPVGHSAYVPSDVNTAWRHRSVGGTFELSPSGSCSRTLDQRTCAPHYSDSDVKLGPYGRQVIEGAAAPPQYGWHVVQQGPAEMDATPMERERPKWEEVESKWDGKMF
jgi:hypothetical protein